MKNEKKISLFKNAGFWSSIIVLIYSIFIFVKSFSFEYYTSYGPGPGFFPMWLGVILIVFSVAYMWESVKKDIVSAWSLLPTDKQAMLKILSTIGGLILFCIITPYTGFTIAGTILLFVMLIHDYKWYKALPASIIGSLILLYLFQSVLGVSLPVNNFGF